VIKYERSDSYYDAGYHRARHPHLIEDDTYFAARAEVQARFYFSNSERQKRIFEYGCGIGQGIAALPNAAGWDISAEARAACRKRNLNIYDTLEEAPKAEWDIVFCRHVLEHLERPIDALACMRELVKPTGELFLVLPKEEHFLSKLGPDLDQHLHCWNFRALNNLLFRAGFTPHTNEYRYALGWHAFLPIRRFFGASVYYHATTFGGILRRNGELVVRAGLA
jgi:SAM-dependent methyltransferase